MYHLLNSSWTVLFTQQSIVILLDDHAHVYMPFIVMLQARSHNEANEAVASPKISKKNLPQMKNS